MWPFYYQRVLAAEVLGVALGVLFPLLRQILECEDRRNRADGDARAAINALHRIDVQHLFGRELLAVLFGVDAVHRTGIDTSRVLRANTRFRDHISHKTTPSLKSLRSGPTPAGNDMSILSKKSAVRWQLHATLGTHLGFSVPWRYTTQGCHRERKFVRVSGRTGVEGPLHNRRVYLRYRGPSTPAAKIRPPSLRRKSCVRGSRGERRDFNFVAELAQGSG